MISSNRLSAVRMVTKITIGGFVLLAVGLLIVIVQALNMSVLFNFEDMLRSLGLILIGIAVQLLGLGLLLIGKK
jgi:hypothetical protein